VLRKVFELYSLEVLFAGCYA